MQVRVRFDEIPDDGLHLEIRDASWFPDHDFERRGVLNAVVDLQRKGRRVLLSGRLDAEIVLDCDRCLVEILYPMVSSFSLDLELAEESDACIEADHACSSNEMDVMVLDEPVVDLNQILCQQVYLSLPSKALCSPSCRGICPHCGANCNETECSCSGKTSSSPFASLSKLKK